MFKVQQNRYLWVHFVGLAAVPLLLDVCLAGLASAGPALPFKVQFWTVAIIGIVPTAWMQIQKPFYIYSLPPLAVKPRLLAENDRRCLTVLKSWQIKALAGLTAVFLLWLLVQIYERLPQISPMMKPGVGLMSAIASFFFVCLFLQISVSVVRSLLIGQDTLQRVKPFEESEIAANFLIPGLRVNKIFSTAPEIANVPDSNRQERSASDTSLDIEKELSEPIEAEREIEDNLEESAEPNLELTEIQGEEKSIEDSIDEDLEDAASVDSLSVEPAEIEAEGNSIEPPLVIPEIIDSD